jgi:hypothetical protein
MSQWYPAGEDNWAPRGRQVDMSDVKSAKYVILSQIDDTLQLDVDGEERERRKPPRCASRRRDQSLVHCYIGI